MKIQLDTTNKTITVEESINFGEFMKVIKRILPNGEWKDFTLNSSSIIYWNNPYLINTQPYNSYPWYNGTANTPLDSVDALNIAPITLTSGVYNIEV